MRIRPLTDADIPRWRTLSSEYDGYVKELAPDLTEWYEGNDGSPAFDFYMEAKINKKEAFMAVNIMDDCFGAIAFSKNTNRVTFFGVAHTADFQTVGGALLRHALKSLDKTKPVFIHEIASPSPWIKQHGKLYLRSGFTFARHSFENGVSVNTFAKFPPS